MNWLESPQEVDFLNRYVWDLCAGAFHLTSALYISLNGGLLVPKWGTDKDTKLFALNCVKAADRKERRTPVRRLLIIVKHLSIVLGPPRRNAKLPQQLLQSYADRHAF